MKNKTTPFLPLAVLGLIGAMSSAMNSAHATEGGGSTYPVGTENYVAGAAPPPGVYVLEYGNYYTASRVNDKAGNQVPIPGFKVRAIAAATRIVWVSPYSLLGGTWAAHTILPLVDLNVSAGGASDHRTGLGDVTVGNGIAWHHSPQLHTFAGVDAVLPVGSYDKTRMANIGRNYLSIQPVGIVTWIDPKGFNGDVKATLNLNRTNNATGYRSGHELILDYAAGWGLGNGWVLGVGGYVYRQLGDDRLNGATVADAKGSGQSIGPSIKYDNGRGWFITAKLEKEFGARNRAEGSQFWVKSTIPF